MCPKKTKYVVTQPSGRVVVAVSKIFQHGKTVVPAEVRRALGLEDGDRMVWVLEEGKWVVESGKSPRA